MLSEETRRSLISIVGAGNCRWGELDLALYSYDSSPFIQQPDAVVFPETAEQAAAVMRLAARENIPLVARGAGTSLSGGAVAWKGGIMMAGVRLNQVLELDLVEETALAECGVVNLDLQKFLEPHDYMFPPDPASQKSSTLGGNLGENAGGMRGVKYGITKHHVLALEVVLADGQIIRTGRLAQGSEAAGPDLTGLFLASEGALGFITKALLKITPLPKQFRTVSAIFDDLGKSGRAVSAIIAAGIIPTAMEIMDHNLIVALEDFLHLGFPLDAEAMLLIEVDGLGPELDRQMDRIVVLCREAGATDLSSAETAEQRDKLWLARRSGNGAMGRIKPALMVQDVTVPVNRLPEMLSLVQEVAAKHEVIIVQMAHAGDGNLHPHILYTPGDDDEYRRAMEASHDIFDAALAAGGALTGEHGIGLEKVDFMDRQFTADELAFMARIKKSLDPQGILNPGKVLPESCLQS